LRENKQNQVPDVCAKFRRNYS